MSSTPTGAEARGGSSPGSASDTERPVQAPAGPMPPAGAAATGQAAAPARVGPLSDPRGSKGAPPRPPPAQPRSATPRRLLPAPPAPASSQRLDGAGEPPTSTKTEPAPPPDDDVIELDAEPPPPPPGIRKATVVGLAPAPESTPAVRAATASAVALDVPLTRRCTTCEARYPADFLVCPRDATPLTEEASEEALDPLLGKLLGETYQIVRVIGEGGMGRVYEARHLRLRQRRYAVKVLHAELGRNPEMAARFMREAESVSAVDHPNVVDVFDVHHLPDGMPYLVGEFLEGEELADFLDTRGRLDHLLAVDVTRQVCAGLGAVHARGIVHRDMKPENIFVLKSSIDALAAGGPNKLLVKVLDFGISKAGGPERSHLTKTGVIMGTPSFMAPEQARGRGVDHRADVYSVGACLYTMLTGARPFDSDDPTATLGMVLTQEPPRPREIDPTIPESLELIVQNAMAKDPSDRYGSMADLDKALEAFALSLGTPQALVRPPLPSSPMPELPMSSSAVDRAIEVAKVVLGGASLAPPGATSAREAKLARPTIAVTSAILGAWVVGGTAAALGGLVRVLNAGELTLTESVLLLVGCVFAAATPFGMYIAHVNKRIWPSTVKAVQVAGDLRRITAVALVSYGALTMLNRVGHTILLRSSASLASGAWDLLLFLASVVCALTVGGFGPLVRNMRRRRSP